MLIKQNVPKYSERQENINNYEQWKSDFIDKMVNLFSNLQVHFS